jgi:argininosuccinate lyase
VSDTKLWGARFRSPPDPALMRLSSSPPSHYRLTPYDLVSSQAHARELERAGLLTDSECATIVAALDAMRREFAAGALIPAAGDEDVHTFLERVLVERLGPLGGKLRAGRSRNDQAANNLRLYLRAVGRDIVTALLALQDALSAQAAQHVDALAPGFTHLQPAQPIVFGHLLLAHAQAFTRDADRMIDWDRRAASPLGAAAPPVPDRRSPQPRRRARFDALRKFDHAVGARDHVAGSCSSRHAGRRPVAACREIVLWSSRRFALIGWTTPPRPAADHAAEEESGHRRARARPLVTFDGSRQTMLYRAEGAVSYNRDSPKTKRGVRSGRCATAVLPAMAGLVRTMVRTGRARAAIRRRIHAGNRGCRLAAMQGVPFAIERSRARSSSAARSWASVSPRSATPTSSQSITG